MAFDQSKADEICERVAQGENLVQICRDDHMPAWRTVYDWLDANPSFAAAYARARAHGFDVIAQDAADIADDGSRDYTETADGRVVPDHDHIARSRLRVETRLKLLAKWDPKRYGDRIQQDVDATVRVVGDDPTKR